MQPNPLLRAARLAAGLSQGQLAERANAEVARATGRVGTLDGNTISRLERGAIVCPVQRHVSALCVVLGASAADLGFERHPAEMEPVQRAVEKPWTVGPEALGAVSSVVAGLRRLEDTTSAATVLPTVDLQVKLADTFAREARSVHRKHAAALAAEVNTYRGWLSIDLGDYRQAERHLRDAVTLAVEAHSSALLTEALGFDGLRELRTGNPVAAASIREAATAQARRPIEQAVAGLHQARTLAIGGDVTTADSVLVEADRAIEQCGDEPPEHDWLYYCTRPFLIVQRGLVHGYAGRNKLAATDLSEGLAGMPAEWRNASWAHEFYDALSTVS